MKHAIFKNEKKKNSEAKTHEIANKNIHIFS